ncbi:MAG: hypothetical protein ACREA4_00705, partial [Nitrososphaera sp.]
IGIHWTDSPDFNRTWDIRPINDMPVSDGLRTEWMPRVMAAYDGAADWPLKRQLSVCRRLVVETVRRIISKLPGTPAEITAAAWRERARVEARAMAAAAEVAEAAWRKRSRVKAGAMAAEAAGLAAAVAGLAAVVAWLAAKSEKEKDVEVIFVATCEFWIDAAENA